jgi:hypothetical protein
MSPGEILKPQEDGTRKAVELVSGYQFNTSAKESSKPLPVEQGKKSIRPVCAGVETTNAIGKPTLYRTRQR